ncbi:helix-turn-helix domain-containing protein [Actinomycetospora endophytica]|uniref:Helix-turn-helix domain-containing protein n=1 Tax=Actinomycetospora endophytica TaxID=2291215 RepID=A0ABS8P4U6_9PSEU|nr:helix-turn-helix domain-containing protein [Actinomycetospora endophytica]MCD2192084.1 helix-turn-helix domain-containing protein [Actinomycetospora endophytica]
MTALAPTAPVGRDLLSSMRSLLVLGKLMTEGADEAQILALATTAARSVARCTTVAVELVGAAAPLDGRPARAGEVGGPVGLPDAGWAWAFPLTGRSGPLGHLVVGAVHEPPDDERFLLGALAQQTGAALADRRLHTRERATATALADLNERLRGTVGALRHSMDVHARLTAVAVSGEGPEGIARALHDLTGRPAAIEDRDGALLAWAGPGRPQPLPPDTADRLVARARREPGPWRADGRVVALARPGSDTLGVIALDDPDGRAGEPELTALEHGATVLAMELSRTRSLAEHGRRRHRDVVDELLDGVDGTDDQGLLARAAALGHDLRRPHRVVVVEGPGGTDTEALLRAVRRATRDEPAGSLLVARGAAVVLLADTESDWAHLRRAVGHHLGEPRVRMGVGERCTAVDRFPRSYRQARLALRLPESGDDDRAVRFDDLGVYRLLVGIEDLAEIDRFVERWLGALLSYDARRGSNLVRTLTLHLEHGGRHELTARSLIVHRSTLKYRLQRIREIGGLDLADPETWFNLHLATRARRTAAVLRAVP